MAAAEPAAAATPRIAPATRFALARRVRVRAAFACGESGEDCGVLVDGELFFELDFLAAEGGDDFFPPRLAAARDGGGEFLPPRLAAARDGGDDLAAVFLAGAFLEELFFAVEAFLAEDLAGDFFDADFLGADFLGADFLGADFFDDFLDPDFFDAAFFAPPLLLLFDLAAISTLRCVRTDGDRTSVPVEKTMHALSAIARITVCRATRPQLVQRVHISRQQRRAMDDPLGGFHAVSRVRMTPTSNLRQCSRFANKLLPRNGSNRKLPRRANGIHTSRGFDTSDAAV